MKLKNYLFVLILPVVIGCQKQNAIYSYKSESLKIEQLGPNAFQHISYLNTQEYGKVSCNGMIVIDEGEALVFDTPVSNSDSKELIDWIENNLKCGVKGIVATHFHNDCIGGLQEFHDRQIPSYATSQTIDLAKSDIHTVPQNGFDNYLELKVGKKIVVNEYVGEGHTKDNIVSYFPFERVLFGGCLIKAIGAGKGNLNDANTEKWSETVEVVKAKYKDAEIIIPGHGKAGNKDLLDYTIELFEKKGSE